MKFEDEFWVITKEDAINYAKLLVANSECENIMNNNKPSYSYEFCLKHAKQQLKRNLGMSEKERKIAHLKKLIFKMKDKYDNDEIINNSFLKLENWFHYLGSQCKLNPIFRNENHEKLQKISGIALNPKRVLF